MNWLNRHWHTFLKNPWQTQYAILLLLVNAGGSIYGYYWYYEQLIETKPALWLFVPDSPLATTLFAAALAFSLLGIRSSLLCLIALTANIKYGLWAVVMITDYWVKGGMVAFPELMLWFSHLGMAIQGAIFLKSCLAGIQTRMGSWLPVVAGWMFLNDFIDYYLGIYPHLYYAEQVMAGAVSAVALSFLLAVVMAFKRSNNNG